MCNIFQNVVIDSFKQIPLIMIPLQSSNKISFNFHMSFREIRFSHFRGEKTAPAHAEVLRVSERREAAVNTDVFVPRRSHVVLVAH